MKIKREIKLAVTAILAVMILIFGINYLKGHSFFEKRNIFYGVYERVDGLKVSSGVIYRGYQVGQVISISFTGARYEHVLVKFSVKDNLRLPRNSFAMIQSDDLMGTKVINLIPGDTQEVAAGGDTLRTRIEQGLMEQVSNQILPLKQKAERLLSSLDSVLSIVQGLFNEETKQSLGNSFQSIDRTLNHLKGASGNLDTLIQAESVRISQIIYNVNGIAENLKNNSENISSILSNVSSITDSIQNANLKQALLAFEGTLKSVDGIFSKIGGGEGSLGALLNDNDLYYNFNMTAEKLNRLLQEFRYNPKKFIRLSLIDFSSAKADMERYGVVIFESDKPLDRKDSLFIQNPGLDEVRYKEKYMYIIESYPKLKTAQRELEDVIKRYKDAYIVKIDFI